MNFRREITLLKIIYYPCVEGMTIYLGAGPLLCVGDDEAPVEKGVAKAT